jgi:predicted transposase YbfD/YdcC
MLASVADPRSPQGIQHVLEFVLAICVVAMLAGARNYREIACHAADIPQQLLKKMGAEWNWFRLRYKHPSESTIRNVLTRIDAAELDTITGAWLYAQARKDGKGESVIALDGKVMRGAWTDENDKVTLFSAMLHGKAVTIAQVRVPDGTNEITQAATLLDAAGIPEGESVLVTVDAAHTQRETAEYIGARPGWNYLMTVKGNQPTLQRQVFDKILPLLSEAPHHIMEEHSRGRIRKWSCWLTGADGIDFPHAAQAACIRREIFEISGDRISKENALILTSGKTGEMTATGVNQGVRHHWGIENKSHYVRDTLYREDHSQAWAGNGPQAMASLRNLALGLFRMKSVKAIKETAEWVCRDQTRALQFMTI